MSYAGEQLADIMVVLAGRLAAAEQALRDEVQAHGTTKASLEVETMNRAAAITSRDYEREQSRYQQNALDKRAVELAEKNKQLAAKDRQITDRDTAYTDLLSALEDVKAQVVADSKGHKIKSARLALGHVAGRLDEMHRVATLRREGKSLFTVANQDKIQISVTPVPLTNAE